jgi:hypothetical protein
MQKGDTVGNWTWYTKQVIAKLERPLEANEYKDLLKMYIAGKPWINAVEEISK